MNVSEIQRVRKFEQLPLEVLARTVGYISDDKVYWPGSFGWLDSEGKNEATIILPKGTEIIMPNGKTAVLASHAMHYFRYDDDKPLFWQVRYEDDTVKPFTHLGIGGKVLLADIQVVKYPESRKDSDGWINILTRPLKGEDTQPVEKFYQNLDAAQSLLRMSSEEFIVNSSQGMQDCYKSRDYNGWNLQSNMRSAPQVLVDNAVQESFGLGNVGTKGVKTLLDVLSEMFNRFEQLNFYRVSRYHPAFCNYSYLSKGNEGIPDRMRTLASYLGNPDAQKYNEMAAQFKTQLDARRMNKNKESPFKKIIFSSQKK